MFKILNNSLSSLVKFLAFIPTIIAKNMMIPNYLFILCSFGTAYNLILYANFFIFLICWYILFVLRFCTSWHMYLMWFSVTVFESYSQSNAQCLGIYLFSHAIILSDATGMVHILTVIRDRYQHDEKLMQFIYRCIVHIYIDFSWRLDRTVLFI